MEPATPTQSSQQLQRQQGLRMIKIGIALLVIVGIAIYIQHQQSTTATSSQPQGKRSTTNLVATVNTSGSTNTSGYQLYIYDNGGATLTCANTRNYSIHCTNKIYPAGTFQVQNLEKTLAKIGDVSTVQPRSGCVKSVSFGTSQSITYNGKTSGDLSCIQSTDPQEYQDLVAQLPHITNP